MMLLRQVARGISGVHRLMMTISAILYISTASERMLFMYRSKVSPLTVTMVWNTNSGVLSISVSIRSTDHIPLYSMITRSG